ncbi:MAG: hypothetical protein V4819_05850 [Verrucomicrobiota bacterium]
MNKTWIILLCALLAAGCKDKRTDLANKAGETVGEHLTEFSKAVGQGVDNKLLVNVVLAPEAQALGITHTTAKALDMNIGKKGITVYLIASKAIEVTLRAKALNANSAEIGRAKVPVKLAKDEAAYFTFEFPKEMDSMMAKEYRIGL